MSFVSVLPLINYKLNTDNMYVKISQSVRGTASSRTSTRATNTSTRTTGTSTLSSRVRFSIIEILSHYFHCINLNNN